MLYTLQTDGCVFSLVTLVPPLPLSSPLPLTPPLPLHFSVCQVFLQRICLSLSLINSHNETSPVIKISDSVIESRSKWRGNALSSQDILNRSSLSALSGLLITPPTQGRVQKKYRNSGHVTVHASEFILFPSTAPYFLHLFLFVN